ncbi:hypothetical protein [Actinoplanes sp. NPDC048796]|uniref:hypothetical protein n=1 Tax=unclassified Actinoplanes TaxID=2626549 RepID=UPI0033C36FC9
MIARVNRPIHQIEGAVGYAFDLVRDGDARLPVLILRLRTGEVVALRGSAGPRSTTFALLHRGPADHAKTLPHFRDLTGLSDIEPL